MQDYFIGLGANLGDREATLKRALTLIEYRIGPRVRCSELVVTPPLNPPEAPDLVQPDYLNAVVHICTLLEPMEVLKQLLAIETELGRRREAGKRWHPRIVDLDLIASGALVVDEPSLTLPHPELHRRHFVLGPLMQIAPHWRHPLLGKTVTEMMADLLQADLLPSGDELGRLSDIVGADYIRATKVCS